MRASIMEKTTSSDDPPPLTPRHSRKKDEVAKNFHLLISGMRGEEYLVALHYHCPEL